MDTAANRFREIHGMVDEFESNNGLTKIWPRPQHEWPHNDLHRVVAYSYQYKLFDYIVSQIGK